MAFPPGLDYRRAPCPVCGARTVNQAEGRCRPTWDQAGEADCPGAREDAAGWLLQPTAKSIAELDAWCIAQMEDESAPSEVKG